MVLEGFCHEDTIIAVDVLDPNIVPFWEQLKIFFQLKSGLHGGLFMTMSV